MAAFEGFVQRAALLTTLALFVHSAFGGIGLTCEDLPKEYCAFSISSEGKRCVLEKYTSGARVKYECRGSSVLAKNVVEHVETDECIEACGLERNWVGISSDSLLEPLFTQKLCSSHCYQACPNIVDLFFNLAAGEGMFLPKLCEVVKGSKSRRGMTEIKSSGLKKDNDSPAYLPIPIDPPFIAVPPEAVDPPFIAVPPEAVNPPFTPLSAPYPGEGPIIAVGLPPLAPEPVTFPNPGAIVPEAVNPPFTPLSAPYPGEGPIIAVGLPPLAPEPVTFPNPGAIVPDPFSGGAPIYVEPPYGGVPDPYQGWIPNYQVPTLAPIPDSSQP